MFVWAASYSIPRTTAGRKLKSGERERWLAKRIVRLPGPLFWSGWRSGADESWLLLVAATGAFVVVRGVGVAIRDVTPLALVIPLLLPRKT